MSNAMYITISRNPDGSANITKPSEYGKTEESLTNNANDTPNEAIKHDTDKLRYDLIPTRPLAQLARVYTEGAKKYADRNWELGMDYSRVYAAIQRHLNAFWAGEDIDKATGVPHVINAAWGCMALCEYATTHPERDDRPVDISGKLPKEPHEAIARAMCPVWPGCDCTVLDKCQHKG